MKKDILYPIFLKCASCVDDTFWRFMYEDLSYGKCPYGISIYKNYISCYIKGKEFSYKLDQTKPKEVFFKEVDTLLRQRAGILSDKEKIIERARVCRLRVDPLSMTKTKKDEWTSVKKKMVRDTLFERYILDQSSKCKFDISVAKRVLSLLIVGLMFKTVTAKDIYYENGYITRVDGFTFTPEKVAISKNILMSKHCVPADHVDTMSSVRSIQSYWPMYLEEIKLV